MIREKIIVDGVPIIVEKDDGRGKGIIELRGKSARDADMERELWLIKQLERRGYKVTKGDK